MNSEKTNIKTPEIHDGGAIQIFACGGQCRGQNSFRINKLDDETNATKLTKVS